MSETAEEYVQRKAAQVNATFDALRGQLERANARIASLESALEAAADALNDGALSIACGFIDCADYDARGLLYAARDAARAALGEDGA